MFFRFLSYGVSEPFILNSYGAPYRFAIERAGRPIDILEVGGGVPHGLIYNMWRGDKRFCKSFTYVDIDALHTDFVEWYCADVGIDASIHRVTAAVASEVPSGNYDFIFAKDIFEHVDNPSLLLRQLIERRHGDGVLALDLEHKGAVVGQHISPDLPPLKELLRSAGLAEAAVFDQVGMWQATIAEPSSVQ